MNDFQRDLVHPVMFSLTSGKGGVGKTSIAVNLAFALSQKKQRVLLVDGDLGLANVDVLLKIPVKGTIRDILENAIDPLSAVVYIEPNLGVLPSGSGVPQMLGLGDKERSYLEGILRNIAKHFDIVLFDTAAGIGPSVLWFNTLVDHNIVVVSPDPTSMTDAYALIKVMSQDRGRSDFHILLNSVKDEKEGREIYATLANVAGRFLKLNPKHLGSVPQDAEVVRAVREQRPFLQKSPQSKAARAIHELAARLMTINGKPEK